MSNEKIQHKTKAIVGQRQIFRRAKTAKLDIILDIHKINSRSFSRTSPSNLPSISSSNLQIPPPTVPTVSDISDNSFCIADNFNDNVVELPSPPLPRFLPVTDNHSTTDYDLPAQLKHWATIQHKVPHNAVDSLLKILTPLCPSLPKDSRTLLKTPINIEVTTLDTGEMVYMGILSQIQKQLKLNIVPSNSEDREIKISFNIDGLPLFKSSNTQLWPVLGLLKNHCDCRPFVVALFCGSSKPSPLNIFLKPFVEELVKLLDDGFNFENNNYTLKVHSFICDAPARAYVKCTKQHGGYSACDKCVEPGEYRGRVVYESVSALRRTNESFRLKSDEDHHVGESPLLDLPIDLVTCFPAEYMHSVCLGVMRKLLNTWISGHLSVRLCSRLINDISDRLIHCARFIPVEFNRKPRSLRDIARFKATEYRMFLLYLGPVVLKNILPKSLYENFLLFHCSITILCSYKYLSDIGVDLAHELLIMFIKHSKAIYGLEFLVYNVHMLCHISEDTRAFGALDDFSAFPFENYLGALKNLVRSPNKPLQQIFKRLLEMESSQFVGISSNDEFLSYPYESGPVPHEGAYECYKKVTLNRYALCVNSYRKADCYCFTKSRKVFKIYNILRSSNGNLLFYGREFLCYESFFDYPFSSTIIDIVNVRELSQLKLLPIDFVQTKCLVIPHENDSSFVSFPLLHSYGDK